jgi:hypothetical protein
MPAVKAGIFIQYAVCRHLPEDAGMRPVETSKNPDRTVFPANIREKRIVNIPVLFILHW